MCDVPDAANFYSSLHTNLSCEQVGRLYQNQGWKLCIPDDWDHLEIIGPRAELVIESERPNLMHGTVAQVEAHAEHILRVLRDAGISFEAECYDTGDTLLREWRSHT